jgi:GR25 family glycosyltransferase involved in LPS biosynthesis
MQRGKTRRKGGINIFNVPTYVVNMKERTDRWKRFTDQPAVHMLKRMKQSNAVNGKKLDPINNRSISVRTRLNIFRNYRRSHHEIATMGAVGCSLSHIEIWTKFLKTGANYCLVMEDDAIITETSLNGINELIPKLPANWGIWLLGCYKANVVYESMAEKPWNRIYNFTASHAYLMTRAAAKILLADALPIESHIDHYMSNISILKNNLIVQHPDVHIEFFKKDRVEKSMTTTVDSNTSQHKKNGCPVCKVPDDYSQIYQSPTRKNRFGYGMKVEGLVRGAQSKEILKLKHNITRKKSRS